VLDLWFVSVSCVITWRRLAEEQVETLVRFLCLCIIFNYAGGMWKWSSNNYCTSKEQNQLFEICLVTKPIKVPILYNYFFHSHLSTLSSYCTTFLKNNLCLFFFINIKTMKLLVRLLLNFSLKQITQLFRLRNLLQRTVWQYSNQLHCFDSRPRFDSYRSSAVSSGRESGIKVLHRFNKVYQQNMVEW